MTMRTVRVGQGISQFDDKKSTIMNYDLRRQDGKSTFLRLIRDSPGLTLSIYSEKMSVSVRQLQKWKTHLPLKFVRGKDPVTNRSGCRLWFINDN